MAQDHLIRACERYHSALHPASPHSSLARPAAPIAEAPEAFLLNCRNHLDEVWGHETSAVGMVRSQLAEFHPTLLPRGADECRKIHLPLLFVRGREGFIKKLTIECFAGTGAVGRWIFPDPHSLGGTALDADFLQAVETAWQYTQAWRAGPKASDFPAQAWLRRRIEPLTADAGKPDRALNGDSAGAAFALALGGL